MLNFAQKISHWQTHLSSLSYQEISQITELCFLMRFFLIVSVILLSVDTLHKVALMKKPTLQQVNDKQTGDCELTALSSERAWQIG